MSREDNFGFTQLVEEDDTDDVANIGESHLDLELQPHLSTFNSNKYFGNTDFENTDHHVDQAIKWQQSAYQDTKKPVVQHGNTAYEARPKEGNPADETETSSSAVYSKTSNKIKLEYPDVIVSSSQTNGVMNHAPDQPAVHIQYSAIEGKVNVMQGQLEIRSDGSRYIDTQGIPEQWSESQRPLRQRKMQFLKVLSIIACILFFPFGIPAVYFAFRTETEFNEGIMKGNIDRAQKFAKRTERLIFISFIMALVIVALVVTAVVRKYNTSSVPRGPIGG